MNQTSLPENAWEGSQPACLGHTVHFGVCPVSSGKLKQAFATEGRKSKEPVSLSHTPPWGRDSTRSHLLL